MPYRIYRHPSVTKDFLSVTSLVAEFAGKDIARYKLDQIERSIANLTETPHIGTVRDHIYPGLRVIPSAQKAVITFTVDEENQSVYVVGVSYAGADRIAQLYKRL